MAELIRRFRRDYETILIDTAPVLSVPDSRILARLADAVILVFRSGHATRDAAAAAMRCFEEDGSPVLGTILNDWNPAANAGAYYGGKYAPYYRTARGPQAAS
jgi:Mrp family chromosome partitioning ATPase